MGQKGFNSYFEQSHRKVKSATLLQSDPAPKSGMRERHNCSFKTGAICRSTMGGSCRWNDVHEVFFGPSQTVIREDQRAMGSAFARRCLAVQENDKAGSMPWI